MPNVSRILRDSFVIFLIASLAVCVGAFWFIAYKGRPLLLKELSALTHRDVSIGPIRIVFPLGLSLENIKISGLGMIPKAVVFLDVKESLQGRLILSSAELFAPLVNVDMASFSKAAEDVTASTDKKTDIPHTLSSDKITRVLPRLTIYDGVLMLQMPEAGRTVVIGHIAADVREVPLGDFSVHTTFKLTASLKQTDLPFLGHLAKIDGWLDWKARDMNAKLSVIDDDGRVGLSADLVSKSNDLSVSGKARIALGQQKQASGAKTRIIEDVVLGLFEATGTEVDSEFSFKTLMDKPVLGQIKLSGTITTGLNSSAVSGNIVGALKALGEQVLGPKAEKP